VFLFLLNTGTATATDVVAVTGVATDASTGCVQMLSCLSLSSCILLSALDNSLLASVVGSFVHGVPDPQRRIAQPLIFFFYI
jgi:hypothetical protein